MQELITAPAEQAADYGATVWAVTASPREPALVGLRVRGWTQKEARRWLRCRLGRRLPGELEMERQRPLYDAARGPFRPDERHVTAVKAINGHRGQGAGGYRVELVTLAAPGEHPTAEGPPRR